MTARMPTYGRGRDTHTWAMTYLSQVAGAARIILARGVVNHSYLHQLMTSARSVACRLGHAPRGAHLQESIADATAVWTELQRLVDGTTPQRLEEELP